MGTNYYIIDGNEHENIYIGKSSVGWVFSLQFIQGKCENWLQWLRLLKKNKENIYDEYGVHIKFNEMINIVTKRSWGKLIDDYSNEEFLKLYQCDKQTFMEKNHCSVGPDNLLRHELGYYCVAHGEGTWDMISGYFS
jgi:hypothetical protein